MIDGFLLYSILFLLRLPDEFGREIFAAASNSGFADLPFSCLSPREGAATHLDPVSLRRGFSVNASGLCPLACASGKRSAAPRGAN
jgi:hypothetical protein